LTRTLDAVRPSYSFDISCQGTVPEAIIAFLESESYEDAVRNAVSLGGDSDTLACITGGIAEAHYGRLPREIMDEVEKRLPADLLEIAGKFRERFNL
jgi:ADP-ribosylglycohydrolase